MSDPSTPKPPPFTPPVSSFGGPIAEMIAQQMLAPPGRPGLLATLNQYEIQRVLGGGGMGIVLLARDTNTGRSVAVKLIRPELVADPQIVHRFVKEAGHLQKLRHPNVIPVLEICDRAAGPYFVMPYFERGSLAARIRPGQGLDAIFILDIAPQIAAGLEFAHRRGIIHRDLKPANILLAGDVQACLADFGLARTMFNDTIVDAERQQCEGTAPYMSPGVAAGNAEDTRCDIYAFGALLYEMLTGEPPYAGGTLQEIRRQILATPPKPIKERNARADGGLCAVAEGAMARELRDRYADMSDVAADLQRIKEGKAPVGPHGLTRAGLRQVRRVSPVLWVAAGVIAAAAVVSSFIRPATQSEPGPLAPVVAATNPPLPRVNPPLVANPPPQTQPRWTASIFAGQSGVAGSQDGRGTNASFRTPGGVAVDMLGNVYVADSGNHTVRKITPDGTVATLAGLAGSRGSLDGRGNGARFFAPFGIAVDSVGNVYVSEVGNCTIRKITPDGQVSTLAGLAGNPGSNDGVGDNAQFRNPFGVAVDASGNLYVADTSNFTIRKVTPKGVVSTLAGLAGAHGGADGPGTNARFWEPRAVAAYFQGQVYVADTGNHAIRRISPGGVVTTVGGSGQFVAAGASSSFIWVADAESRAIRGLPVSGDAVTLRVDADVGHPDALAAEGHGDIYVADTMNNVIRKLTPARPSPGR
ncbi:MAG: serine/threonine-protein kinase [Verrucomicrobiota bacterium]|jgi:serine/threonine protein kinase/sugar lactone lactonase YvrE